MAIQTTTTANSTTRTDLTSATSTPVSTAPMTAAEAQARNKTLLNTQIVQASLTVSIGAGNEPQQLVLRSVVDRLNEMLDDGSGVAALDTASQQDNTPDGTAGRIVSLSTAFYGAYAAQHPGEDPATTAASFVDVIRSGVEKGFQDAKHILEGLGVLGGDVADNIEKTYALVMKGLDDFLAKFQAPQSGTPAEGATGAESAAESAA